MDKLPLAGVRILDCTALLPGPYCTMMLAELGAEVIKVERAGVGDFMGQMSPGCYKYMNGNKRLLSLNLKEPQSIEIIKKIAVDSAVFVEGFRPGVVKRLGIDFDSLKEVNPHIIYCSISGYGQTGPNRDLPGHDINYQSIAGLFSISGDPDLGPVFPSGIQTADIAGTMYAVISILAALKQPVDTPARLLDVSLANSMASWMMPRFMEFIDRRQPQKAKFMGRGPYGIFQTLDGRYLSLGVVEDHFWINLCNLLGFKDWAADKSFSGWITRNKRRHEITPRLEAAFKSKDLEYWLSALADADVPASQVREFDDWINDKQFKETGFIAQNSDGTLDENNFRRFPVDFVKRDEKNKEEKPFLGRDNDAILQEIGIASTEIARLKAKKVI